MPSSWDVYYVVFLSALLALGIPGILGLISYLVSSAPKEGAPASMPALPTGDLLKRKINARVFLGVNVALVLLTLALALIPCTSVLQQRTDGQLFLRGLIALVSLSFFCGLGLLYSSRKGDLNWVQSFQRPASKGKD